MGIHPPRRAVKGTLLAISLLLAGALCSFAGAWAIELVRAYRQSRVVLRSFSVPFDGDSYTITEGGAVYRAYERRSCGRTAWWISSFKVDPLGDPSGSRPWWVNLPPPGQGQGTSAVAFGLPFGCLKYDGNTEEVETPLLGYQSKTRRRNVVCWFSSDHKFQAYLPLHPILPNLLLNTLFYATLFSTPYLLRQTRRHLRLRRGHCPFCNYDLRNDFSRPCSECGRTTALVSKTDKKGQVT